MKIKKRKWVTLLELMIVIWIIAVLSIILFRTFGSISQIAFRIEQEKNVTNEIISMMQVLQNYADRNTIDYEKYRNWSGYDLINNKWLTDILYLSGQDWNLKFYSSGDCINPSEVPLSGLFDKTCWLYLEKEDKTISIVNTNKIYLSKMIFKIIPFAREQDYIDDKYLCDDLAKCIAQPGFWIFVQWYNSKYVPHLRSNNVNIKIQNFFNLK